MPPSASCTLPDASATAPVNAPFRCPKSELDISSAESAGQLTLTNGRRRARAVGADPARQHVLPRAALAPEEHPAVGRRRAPRRLQEGAERGARRVEEPLHVRLVEPPRELRDLALERRRRDHPPRGVAHLLGRERLGQVVDRAQLHRLHRALEGGERGDDDHRRPRLAAEDLRQHGQPRLRIPARGPAAPRRTPRAPAPPARRSRCPRRARARGAAPARAPPDRGGATAGHPRRRRR